MKIAVCDDEVVFTTHLKEILNTYSNSHNWEAVIDIFSSGIDLINANRKYDIILMDYQMAELDGIETSKILRETSNPFSCIIFLTNYPEMAIEAYSVDTYRFVVKDNLVPNLYEALDSYRKRKQYDKLISVKVDGELLLINSKDIVFVEAIDKHITIHLNSSTSITARMKLSAIYELLPHTHFCQAHKSFVVNFYYVEKITKTDIRVIGYANKLPLSRMYAINLKEQFRFFICDQM